MRYVWLFILLGILALSIFNNLPASSKSNLAALIQLLPLDEPLPIKQNNRSALAADIYSTYPFNHRNQLILNAGSAHGVKEKMPVTVEGNFLLGRVIQVSEKNSIVETIFDPNFSLSVRVGNKAVNALLSGGQDPKLTLIEKSAEISEGDSIISVSKDFPYGSKVGSVGAINDDLLESFKETQVEFPYKTNDLRQAVILLDHAI